MYEVSWNIMGGIANFFEKIWLALEPTDAHSSVRKQKSRRTISRIDYTCLMISFGDIRKVYPVSWLLECFSLILIVWN